MFKQIEELGPNAVATVNLGTGAFELGAGRGMKVAGGSGLAFWNARTGATSKNGVLGTPDGVTVSGNGGLLANGGSAAAKGLEAAGAFLSKAPNPAVRAAGATLVAIGGGSGALGEMTETDVWVGPAGRASVTIKGTRSLIVKGPDGGTWLDTNRIPQANQPLSKFGIKLGTTPAFIAEVVGMNTNRVMMQGRLMFSRTESGTPVYWLAGRANAYLLRDAQQRPVTNATDAQASAQKLIASGAAYDLRPVPRIRA